MLAIDMLKALSPWRIDSSDAGDCEALFDNKRPTLFAIDLPDQDKIEQFNDWVAYSIVQPILDKGIAFFDQASDLLKLMINFCLAATDESDLTDDIAGCVFDAVTCFRGLMCLCHRAIAPDLLGWRMQKAVQQLRLASYKAGSQSVCYKVAQLISKDQAWSDTLREYLKHEVGAMEQKAGVEQAYSALGSSTTKLGTAEHHSALGKIMEQLPKWEAVFRPGATKPLSDAARRSTCEHLQAIAGSNGGGDGGVSLAEAATMAARACSVWPLSEDFVQLAASIRKQSVANSHNEMKERVDGKCNELKAVLVVKKGAAGHRAGVRGVLQGHGQDRGRAHSWRKCGGKGGDASHHELVELEGGMER